LVKESIRRRRTTVTWLARAVVAIVALEVVMAEYSRAEMQHIYELGVVDGIEHQRTYNGDPEAGKHIDPTVWATAKSNGDAFAYALDKVRKRMAFYKKMEADRKAWHAERKAARAGK
jgi:hypothetical protein